MVDEEEMALAAGQEDYLNAADPSILRFLIAAREEVDSTQLRDDLLSMLVAGHETTASVLTWTLYLLAQNPQQMAKAQVRGLIAALLHCSCGFCMHQAHRIVQGGLGCVTSGGAATAKHSCVLRVSCFVWSFQQASSMPMTSHVFPVLLLYDLCMYHRWHTSFISCYLQGLPHGDRGGQCEAHSLETWLNCLHSLCKGGVGCFLAEL